MELSAHVGTWSGLWPTRDVCLLKHVNGPMQCPFHVHALPGHDMSNAFPGNVIDTCVSARCMHAQPISCIAAHFMHFHGTH